MKNIKHQAVVISTLLMAFCVLSMAGQSIALAQGIDSKYLFTNRDYLNTAVLIQKKAHTTQAAGDKSEDGDPTGPDTDIKVLLDDELEEYSPQYIRKDFLNHIPFSPELIRDHTSLNTYYFYPSEYLLRRDPQEGFDLKFLHRSREDGSASDLIRMTFTLAPRELNGGLPLLTALANQAIKPDNNKAVELKRLPISSVRVSFSGLSAVIPEENLIVTNSPRKVGDEIKVQATMTQVQKEELVSLMRTDDLSGEIFFSTNNDSVELVLNYNISFKSYSGEWISDISRLGSNDFVVNSSPYPLALSGLVAYTKSGNSLKRYFMPVKEPVIMSAGARANADKAFQQMLSAKGNAIAYWPAYKAVQCEPCLNAIERKILVAPGLTSKTDLPIEAVPNVFSEFGLFKIMVEVRSNYLSASGGESEVKAFTLRPDETQAVAVLFIDRDKAEQEKVFEYRIKPTHLDGTPTRYSEWWSEKDTMDITIHSGLVRDLIDGSDRPSDETD